MHNKIYSKRIKIMINYIVTSYNIGFSNMLRVNVKLCTYCKPGFIEIDSKFLL